MSISAEYNHSPHVPTAGPSSTMSDPSAYPYMDDPSGSHAHAHVQAHAAMLGMHDLGGLDVGDGLDDLHAQSMSPHAHILSGPSTGTSHSHSVPEIDEAEGDMTDFDKLQHDYTNMGEDESGEMAGDDAVTATVGPVGGPASGSGSGGNTGVVAVPDDTHETILGDDGLPIGTLSRLDPRTSIQDAFHRNMGINTGDLQNGVVSGAPGGVAQAQGQAGANEARSRSTSGKSNGTVKKRGRDDDETGEDEENHTIPGTIFKNAFNAADVEADDDDDEDEDEPSNKRSKVATSAGATSDGGHAGGFQLVSKDGDPMRRKIRIEYITDKSRRHITFSKRKSGIMKKAYELSILTGVQLMLLVVSETGLVYTFTTAKLQPIVKQPEGMNLIQACLNAPEGVGPDGKPTAIAAIPTVKKERKSKDKDGLAIRPLKLDAASIQNLQDSANAAGHGGLAPPMPPIPQDTPAAARPRKRLPSGKPKKAPTTPKRAVSSANMQIEPKMEPQHPDQYPGLHSPLGPPRGELGHGMPTHSPMSAGQALQQQMQYGLNQSPSRPTHAPQYYDNGAGMQQHMMGGNTGGYPQAQQQQQQQQQQGQQQQQQQFYHQHQQYLGNGAPSHNHYDPHAMHHQQMAPQQRHVSNYAMEM